MKNALQVKRVCLFINIKKNISDSEQFCQGCINRIKAVRDKHRNRKLQLSAVIKSLQL